MFPLATDRFAALLAIAAGLPCGDSGKITVEGGWLYPNDSARKGRAVAQDLTGEYAPLGLEPEFEQVDPRLPLIRIVERKAKP